jgi:hypothetical protein
MRAPMVAECPGVRASSSVMDALLFLIFSGHCSGAMVRYGGSGHKNLRIIDL